MEDHDLDLLVLGRVANMRYVSGVPVLWNAGSRPFGPGCVAVRASREIYLLSTWDEGVPDDIPHDHLYGITWNPMNYVAVLKGIAADIDPGRVGTDGMSPLFAQLLPMAFPNADLVDGSPALRAARRIKTAEEVEAIRAAIEVADGAMAAAVAELRAGVSERELAGVYMDAMAARGVTTPATQDVIRVTTAGRPRAPRLAGRLEAGDLVAFDAGVVADGYTGEVGRTWPVSPAATAILGRLYRRWDELWARLFDACQAGASAAGLLEAYRAAGEPLPAAPIGRGLGLGFDDPLIAGDLSETASKEMLEPGVVMVVTGCVSDDRVGRVIAHQPLLITPDGPVVLSSSPFWNHDYLGAHG